MDDKLIVHKLPDFETIEIFGVCDGHFGDPKTDEQMFKDFVKYIGAEPNLSLIHISEPTRPY